jgi:hypothetical protein
MITRARGSAVGVSCVRIVPIKRGCVLEEKAEGRDQRTETRGHRPEGIDQRTETRGQRPEDRDQRAETRGHRQEGIGKRA